MSTDAECDTLRRAEPAMTRTGKGCPVSSIPIVVGVVGGLALVGVLTVVLLKRAGHAAAREQRDNRITQVEGLVVETRSQRHNVLETAYVNHHALVRFTVPDGQSLQAWLPSYQPTKAWQVPGQRVLIACNPADPSDAHVERAL